MRLKFLVLRLRYPMVVWEGEAQKGGFGGGTLAPAPPSMAPPPLATASPPLRWGVVLPCWRTMCRADRFPGARELVAALPGSLPPHAVGSGGGSGRRSGLNTAEVRAVDGPSLTE